MNGSITIHVTKTDAKGQLVVPVTVEKLTSAPSKYSAFNSCMEVAKFGKYAACLLNIDVVGDSMLDVYSKTVQGVHIHFSGWEYFVPSQSRAGIAYQFTCDSRTANVTAVRSDRLDIRTSFTGVDSGFFIRMTDGLYELRISEIFVQIACDEGIVAYDRK